MIWDLIKASFGWHLKSHQRQSFPLHWAKKSSSAEISLFSWKVPFSLFLLLVEFQIFFICIIINDHHRHLSLSSDALFALWRVWSGIKCKVFQLSLIINNIIIAIFIINTSHIYILAEKCFQINSDLLTLTPLWANWIELPLCTGTSLIITLFLRIKELQVLYHPSQAASLARNRKRAESNLIIIKAFISSFFLLISSLQKNMLDLKLKSETLFFLRFSPGSTFPPYPSKWHFYRRTDDPPTTSNNAFILAKIVVTL